MWLVTGVCLSAALLAVADLQHLWVFLALAVGVERLLKSLVYGIATLDPGEEALVEPLPPGLTEGAGFHAEIVREAIPEPGRSKLAKARATDAEPRPGLAQATLPGVEHASAPHRPPPPRRRRRRSQAVQLCVAAPTPESAV